MITDRLRDDALERLLATARSRGWRDALDATWPPPSQVHRYASDPREGDTLYLLPGGGRRRALFLGNALGILPCLLARLFESVLVADWDPGRLAFARRRQDEEAIVNLRCVDLARVDGEFDLVVLGDERPDAATSLPFHDPATLFAVSRLVAREGCLMYAVRFRLLRSLVRRAGRGRRATPPIGYPAHERLLAGAGFSHVDGYWRRPDHRPYRMHVPIDRRAAVAYSFAHAARARHPRARLSDRVHEAAHRARVLPHLIDNFLLIAWRG